MSLRESIAKHPAITAIVAGLVAVASIAYVWHSAAPGPATMSNKAYFTTDDGQTVFVDSMDHLPPFDHDGKPAYRVWMFTSDGGTTKFPGYLERYTPESRAKLQAAIDDFKSGKTHGPLITGSGETEVKKPGAGNPWVSRMSAAGNEVVSIKSTDSNPVDVVMP